MSYCYSKYAVQVGLLLFCCVVEFIGVSVDATPFACLGNRCLKCNRKCVRHCSVTTDGFK